MPLRGQALGMSGVAWVGEGGAWRSLPASEPDIERNKTYLQDGFTISFALENWEILIKMWVQFQSTAFC